MTVYKLMRTNSKNNTEVFGIYSSIPALIADFGVQAGRHFQYPPVGSKERFTDRAIFTRVALLSAALFCVNMDDMNKDYGFGKEVWLGDHKWWIEIEGVLNLDDLDTRLKDCLVEKGSFN